MAAKPTPPPPAYFLSLSLKNVRSFGDKQTISFARPDGRPTQWTILLGDNGVGKTTVLKALVAHTPESDPRIPGAHGTKYFENWNYKWEPIRSESLDSKMNCEIGRGCFIYSHNRPNYDWIKIKQEVSVEWFYGKPSKEEFVINHNLKAFVCFAYGAGRSTGNSTLSETPEVVDLYASLFNDRADLLNPEEWFLQMEYSSLKQDEQAAKALEQVRQVLLQVLPDVTDLRISSKGHQQYLELETPYGWVRLRDMSLGYQTLVVWLTDFASKLFTRYPDSPNPLEEPAIVLIDEIDLHLHPSWQRKLIGFLSGIFKNTQFIATAHSPLVVQAATDAEANVVLLKREGDQTIVYQGADLPDVQRWRIDQILSSELFDDTPPLSPQTEADLTRRNKLLLLKEPLTDEEKAELDRLTTELTGQPGGTTRPERRAEDLLALLARNLAK